MCNKKSRNVTLYNHKPSCTYIAAVTGTQVLVRGWKAGLLEKISFLLPFEIYRGVGSIRVLVSGWRAELIRKDIVYVTF